MKDTKSGRRWIDLNGVLPLDANDLITFLGLAAVLVGGWLVEPAASFLLCGGALFYLAVFRRREKR